MTDTGPTPERRWRTEEGYLYTPAGAPVADFVAEDAESDLVLATLNEAEDLRADAEAHRRGSDGHGCDEYIPDHAFSGAAFEGIGCEHCGRKRERHALADDRETLRAERDALLIERADLRTAWAEPNEEIIGLRERVRVLEARLEKATTVIKALEATQLVAGVLSKAYDEWRGLAGAETPACSTCGHRHEEVCRERVIASDPSMSGAVLYCGCDRADGGERRGG